MDGVKYKSVPPGINEYHGWLVTQEGNSGQSPADKYNCYKVEPIILQISLIMETCWRCGTMQSLSHTALR
jgi:hypothetical protein